MEYEKIIKAVTRYAEINGWSVQTEKEPRLTTFEFGRLSPAGQDFSCSAVMVEDDLYSLVRDVADYYDSFDTDREAYLWLDSSGHGKNGAPYHMRDVLDDMEAVYDMLEHFLNVLQDLEAGYLSY